VIGIVGRADAVDSYLDQSCGRVGVEVAQQVVILFDHGIKFVAQSVVHGEVFSGAEIVLYKKSVGPVVNGAAGIAHLHRGLEGIAGEEIFEGGGVGESHATEESDAAAGIAIGAAAEFIAMDFAAKLDGMLAHRVRDVIDELSDGIRALKFRPFETAEAGYEGAGETDARQASGVGAAHPGVQVISRCRRI